MNDKTKESKFLDAIHKYAERQQAQITKEIEDYKNAKIEQATQQGLQDAYDLIRDDVAKRKAAIVNDVAKQELALRNELFRERQTISDEVFRQAREKLRLFAQTEDYTGFLARSLQLIAQKCGADKCVVRLAPIDESRREWVLTQLSDTEIIIDKQITIGGIKAYCPAQGIMLDDTLDARLNEQRAWFNENSGLEVV